MRTLVLSDLHLGNGSAYEIFEGGEMLPALLDAEAGPDLHVLLNGDAVDFLLDDDPLLLDLKRAVGAAQATAAHPPTAAVFAALGRLLARGGQVTVRLGNHDVELAIPEVQAVFRAALAQPDEVSARLVFTTGEEPAILDVGGVKILITHGEHRDPWNKVDYKHLLDRESWGEFSYGPGSKLVKNMLNPLKKDFGLRFADLLKPDFHGGVMASLAVDPGAVRAVSPTELVGLAARVFKRSFEAGTFIQGDADTLGPMEDILTNAELSTEERDALWSLLGDGPSAFADPEVETSARSKLLTAALKLYANVHRSAAGNKGALYFELAPDEAEWKEAKRLAKKYTVDAVIFGHTHAARWGEADGLLFANTGTWIGLMQLPAPDASPESWREFLELLQRNPGLDPSRGPSVPVLTRFTGVEIAAHPDGGAQLALVEWQKGARIVLGEIRLLSTDAP